MFTQVIKNSNGCNLAVDIWSLGCTVLEMATTKPPWSQFEGVSNLSADVALIILDVSIHQRPLKFSFVDFVLSFCYVVFLHVVPEGCCHV